MPETIIFDVAAAVASGPTIKSSRTVVVDAYDKISVTVPDGSSDLEVDIAPGAAGTVKLLLVTSSTYGEDLTYKVNADAADHPLDEPHVLTGAGAVALLDAAAAKLTFANGLGSDADVQILIGRDATP
jgi:hypothetical protein